MLKKILKQAFDFGGERGNEHLFKKKHTKVPLNRSRFPRSHLPDNRSRSSWDDVQWPIMQNVLLLSDDKLVFLGSEKSKLISHCLKRHTNKQV